MTVHTILERPSTARCDEFLAAVARSRKLHAHWAHPPKTAKALGEYLKRMQDESNVGYWVCTEAGELAGVVNITEIVRGGFCSAYLGYYAFVPHHGKGHMTQGLRAVLAKAFGEHQLHRLEANIQPDNVASRKLLKRLGFRQEGFSPRYLKITGRWRDHERWAMTVEDWRAGFAPVQTLNRLRLMPDFRNVDPRGSDRQAASRVRRGTQDRRFIAMTDMQREAISVLTEVWQLSSDVRLGQLMAHLDFLGESLLGKGLGYIDDDELVAILYRHRTELKARLEGKTNEELQKPAPSVSVS